MQYTNLGRTGLKVSRICLGTMNFGTQTTPEDSFAIMDRALATGTNFFDTADRYGRDVRLGYTEEIIGWSVGPTLDTDYPMEALRMALRRIEGKDEVNLIHHSDRGCQYACREYVGMLRKHGIRVSMTESGDPKDNAQAERINNTMKNELLKGKVFRNINEVVAAVARAVDFYNNRRPQMSIGMNTPS